MSIFKVKRGDTASEIAQNAGLTPKQFLNLNPSFAARGGNRDWQGLTGDIQVGQEYRLAPNRVEELSARNKSPYSDIVRSSSAVRQDEATTKDNLNDFDEQAYRDNFTGYMSEIDKRIAELTGDQGVIRGINNSYDTMRRNTENKQNKETGSTSAALARMGGYLGPSASATGAMIDLNKQHRYEITDLESRRQKAITEAKLAMGEKRFDVVKFKMKQARDIEDQIQGEKDKFFKRAKDVNNRKASTNRKSYIADKIQSGTKEPIDIFLDMIDSGYQDVNIDEITDMVDSQKQDLKGTSSDYRTFKQFYPDGTFNDFQSYLKTTSSAKRKPSSGGVGNTFTRNQLQKLEQVGLSNASRKDKLDYLFSDSSDGSNTFTKNQLQKLEQIGLLDASREDKLNYLFANTIPAKDGDIDEIVDYIDNLSLHNLNKELNAMKDDGNFEMGKIYDDDGYLKITNDQIKEIIKKVNENRVIRRDTEITA